MDYDSDTVNFIPQILREKTGRSLDTRKCFFFLRNREIFNVQEFRHGILTAYSGIWWDFGLLFYIKRLLSSFFSFLVRLFYLTPFSRLLKKFKKFKKLEISNKGRRNYGSGLSKSLRIRRYNLGLPFILNVINSNFLLNI